MAYDFKSETEVKEFIQNLGIEYRFGCYSEKKPEVCHLLGDFLEAIKKDFEKAGKLYKTNCDDFKYGKSCYKYASYCLIGKGGLKEDFPSGLKYLQMACEEGESEGCFNQGLVLITNNEDKGIKMDIPKGMDLLKRACDAKNANACYYLSGMYISGVRNKASGKKNDYVSKPDMRLAYSYAKDGCHLGNIYSCVNLSQMYGKGEGVEKNQELADKYKKMALEMQQDMESNKTLSFQEGLKSS